MRPGSGLGEELLLAERGNLGGRLDTKSEQGLGYIGIGRDVQHTLEAAGMGDHRCLVVRVDAGEGAVRGAGEISGNVIFDQLEVGVVLENWTRGC